MRRVLQSLLLDAGILHSEECGVLAYLATKHVHFRFFGYLPHPNNHHRCAALLANCGRVRLADLCHPGNMRLLAAPVEGTALLPNLSGPRLGLTFDTGIDLAATCCLIGFEEGDEAGRSSEHTKFGRSSTAQSLGKTTGVP